MRRFLTRRRLLVGLAALLLGGLLAWHFQSRLIGVGARWYLQRTAAREERSGELTQRRAAIARIHRQLLIAPPEDGQVAELYDLVALLAARVATGEISLSWSAYIYTSHLRDMVETRPGGSPRLAVAALEETVQRQVEFFYLRKRSDQDGYRLGDLIDEDAGESFTLEEIEEAHRQGRDLTAE